MKKFAAVIITTLFFIGLSFYIGQSKSDKDANFTYIDWRCVEDMYEFRGPALPCDCEPGSLEDWLQDYLLYITENCFETTCEEIQISSFNLLEDQCFDECQPDGVKRRITFEIEILSTCGLSGPGYPITIEYQDNTPPDLSGCNLPVILVEHCSAATYATAISVARNQVRGCAVDECSERVEAVLVTNPTFTGAFCDFNNNMGAFVTWIVSDDCGNSSTINQQISFAGAATIFPTVNSNCVLNSGVLLPCTVDIETYFMDRITARKIAFRESACITHDCLNPWQEFFEVKSSIDDPSDFMDFINNFDKCDPNRIYRIDYFFENPCGDQSPFAFDEIMPEIIHLNDLNCVVTDIPLDCSVDFSSSQVQTIISNSQGELQDCLEGCGPIDVQFDEIRFNGYLCNQGQLELTYGIYFEVTDQCQQGINISNVTLYRSVDPQDWVLNGCFDFNGDRTETFCDYGGGQGFINWIEDVKNEILSRINVCASHPCIGTISPGTLLIVTDNIIDMPGSCPDEDFYRVNFQVQDVCGNLIGSPVQFNYTAEEEEINYDNCTLWEPRELACNEFPDFSDAFNYHQHLLGCVQTCTDGPQITWNEMYDLEERLDCQNRRIVYEDFITVQSQCVTDVLSMVWYRPFDDVRFDPACRPGDGLFSCPIEQISEEARDLAWRDLLDNIRTWHNGNLSNLSKDSCWITDCPNSYVGFLPRPNQDPIVTSDLIIPNILIQGGAEAFLQTFLCSQTPIKYFLTDICGNTVDEIEVNLAICCTGGSIQINFNGCASNGNMPLETVRTVRCTEYGSYQEAEDAYIQDIIDYFQACPPTGLCLDIQPPSVQVLQTLFTCPQQTFIRASFSDICENEAFYDFVLLWEEDPVFCEHNLYSSYICSDPSDLVPFGGDRDAFVESLFQNALIQNLRFPAANLYADCNNGGCSNRTFPLNVQYVGMIVTNDACPRSYRATYHLLNDCGEVVDEFTYNFDFIIADPVLTPESCNAQDLTIDCAMLASQGINFTKEQWMQAIVNGLTPSPDCNNESCGTLELIGTYTQIGDCPVVYRVDVVGRNECGVLSNETISFTRTFVEGPPNVEFCLGSSVSVSCQNLALFGFNTYEEVVEDWRNNTLIPNFRACYLPNGCDVDTDDDLVEVIVNITVEQVSCPYRVKAEVQGRNRCGTLTEVIEHYLEIRDTDPPLIENCPDNLTVNCNDALESIDFWVASALGNIVVSDACGSATLTHNWTYGTLPTCQSPLVVTFTATDDCGNTSTCSAQVTLEDNEDPQWIGPLPTDEILCNAPLPEMEELLATDNCTQMLTYTSSSVLNADQSSGCNQVYTRVWTAEDECGNMISHLQNITIILDEQPPQFTGCPVDQTFACESNFNALMDQILGNLNIQVEDNCGAFETDINIEFFPGFCGLRARYTATYTDYCGNASTCTFSLYGSDDTPPVITSCPEDLDIPCETPLNQYASIIDAYLGTNSPTYTDNCGIGSVGFQLSGQIADLTCTNPLTVTWTVMDACENTAQCSSQIRIIDMEAPQIVCPDDLTIDCSVSDIDAIVNNWILNASATDNCAQVSISHNYTGLEANCQNPQVVTFSASDDCGNSVACHRSITIIDEVPPVFICGPDISFECSVIGSEQYIQSLTEWLNNPGFVQDFCQDNVTITHDFVALTATCNSPQLVTFTADDGCNNTSTCSKTIYIFDNDPPVITCQSDRLEVFCTGLNQMELFDVWANEVSAIDCSEPVIITHDFDGVFPACGPKTVVFSATDDCGNVATCSNQIIVLPPPGGQSSIQCPQPLVLDCELATEFAVEQWASQVTAMAPCGIEFITFDFGGFDYSCSPVEVVFSARDLCGFDYTCTSTVTISDNLPPVITCPGDLTLDCDENPDQTVANWRNSVQATDNCSAVTIVDDYIGHFTSCLVPTIVTFTATDECGNFSTCSREIIVVDNEAPTWNLPIPGDITISCSENLPSPPPIEALDNCDEPEVQFEEIVLNTGCSGAQLIRRTWYAEDPCGNSISGEQLITVEPAAVASFTSLPSDVTISCGAAPPQGTNLTYTNGQEDGCEISGSVVGVITGSHDACGGTYMETWTYMDACERTITHSRTITVEPAAVASFTSLPSDVTIICGDGPPVATELTYTNSQAGGCEISGMVLGVLSGDSGACGGTLTETWTYMDACGRTITHSRTITVEPIVEASFVGSLPADITITCEEAVGFPIQQIDVSNGQVGTCSINGVALPSLTSIPDECGVYTVVWNYTDACGREIQHEQRVTVNDGLAPVFVNCPSDITVSNVSEIPTGIPADLMATDNCGNVQYTFVDNIEGSGVCGDPLVYRRVYSATDGCGNTTTCEQRISVNATDGLTLRVYLEGSLMNNKDEFSSTGRPLMRDDLRLSPFTGLDYLPETEPYTLLSNFNHVGSGGGETLLKTNPLWTIAGEDAIVDWVFIELRDKSNPAQIVATRSALLQRDGDIVDIDGGCLKFPGVAIDEYYIAVRHRNHLGVMTGSAINLGGSVVVDFTSPGTSTWDRGGSLIIYDYTGMAQKPSHAVPQNPATGSKIINGYMAMWAGNANRDNKIKYASPNDDQTNQLFEVILFGSNISFVTNYDFAYGYFGGDYDMNSKLKYSAPNDDQSLLFLQLLLYSHNSAFVTNFDWFLEQLP